MMDLPRFVIIAVRLSVLDKAFKGWLRQKHFVSIR